MFETHRNKKTTLGNLFILVFCLFTVLTLNSHWAQAASQFEDRLASLKIESIRREGSQLKMTIQETEAVGNACDLTVSRFEYLQDLSVLSIEVKPCSFCPLDAITERSAHFSWQLPADRRSSKAALAVRINGKVLGQFSYDTLKRKP